MMGVKSMVNTLSLEDLRRLKADLENGGRHLHALVSTRVKDLEVQPAKICATCGNDITDNSEHYTLVFGPPDLRKKASFCAQDCLNYFVKKLNKVQVRGDLE